MILAFFLTSWFHYFYVPTQGAWYTGNVWGNAMVLLVLGPLGWLWSRTKFWPLRPVKHALRSLHEKFDVHTQRQDEHNLWVADHLAAIHRKQGLGEPAPHPHFELPQAHSVDSPEPIKPHTTLHIDHPGDIK